MAPGATKWQAFTAFETESVASGPTISSSDFTSNAPTRKSFKTRAPFHVPDELTCTLCLKPKNLRGFSINQQNKYRDSRGTHQIICIHCNGIKKTEITCSICDKTLPLKKFAKSQRSGGQECLDCVAKRIGAESDHDDDFAVLGGMNGDGAWEGDSACWENGGADATWDQGDQAGAREGHQNEAGKRGKSAVAGSEIGEGRGRAMPEGSERQRKWVPDEERYDLGEEWDRGSVISVEESDSEEDGSVFSV
ncbi:Hypothetical protein D9617_18g033520 [Elsinoe fawcettii]|nr:Hypothetical protein D9617_18g033520 [Elsinoe fawcettii]